MTIFFKTLLVIAKEVHQIQRVLLTLAIMLPLWGAWSPAGGK